MTPPRDQQSAKLAQDLAEKIRRKFDERGTPRFYTYEQLYDLIHDALAAHDEALPGDWRVVDEGGIGTRSIFCGDTLVCPEVPSNLAAAIVDAHNSALRPLIDALRWLEARIDAEVATTGPDDPNYPRTNATMKIVTGMLLELKAISSKALQPYSGQKDGKL